MAISVLVVEDERNIGESLRFLMNRQGYDVRLAHDGREALDLLEAGTVPDLLLLDIMMPGCDGFAVARAVRANPALDKVRIVMLTAKGKDVDRRKGLDLGVDDYILKPFSTRDVVARVRALLEPEPAAHSASA
ncbi:transcriptional regulatory protein [Caenispirillum salinarum AK4]|uniref:Transcriptional regulatory protein n=1 Tax=Caenispirillum salinarum AK4 TaxID=1238182 RepID=K9H6U9_9PROT|nr:response regulator [Caenispirillum salinarum]EKV32784.1 transcriptional regulatory protein [Caenispirillum salinarum AK4]